MVDAFLSLGFEVSHLYTNERELNVAEKLRELDFQPDLILQQENLGCRVFLSGMHEVNCLKIFWSVDTHLNMHWHRYYGSLFDGVLTTQKKYVRALERDCDSEIFWVPWMGAHRNERVLPYHVRDHEITFVGRVSKERRSRQWFVDFLTTNYDLYLVDGLNYSQMMDVYRQTRIVPNEAIFGEINFRLFEACSCGCAVVTPYVEGIEDLFDIGVEIEVYNDVLELRDILSSLSKDHHRAASLGLAGYARVMRDHLPENRAVSILNFAGSLTPKNVSDESYTYLSEAALGEAGDPAVNWQKILNYLLQMPSDKQRDAALMRIFAINGAVEPYLTIARPYLTGQADDPECYFYMSASLSAAKLGLFDLAKHFCFNYFSQKHSAHPKTPDDIQGLLIIWGDELFKSGISVRSGIAFNEESGIPACAADCYFAALYNSPGNLSVFKKLDSVFTGVKGAEPSRLGFLSHLSLHNPNDWRVSLDLGITNLKVFRLTEGLKELEHARSIAMSQGAERFFRRKVETDLPAYFKLVYG